MAPKGKSGKKGFVPFEKYGSMTERYTSAAQRGKHEKGEGKPGEKKEKAMAKGAKGKKK
jgi:hypothetical protein